MNPATEYTEVRESVYSLFSCIRWLDSTLCCSVEAGQLEPEVSAISRSVGSADVLQAILLQFTVQCAITDSEDLGNPGALSVVFGQKFRDVLRLHTLDRGFPSLLFLERQRAFGVYGGNRFINADFPCANDTVGAQ